MRNRYVWIGAVLFVLFFALIFSGVFGPEQSLGLIWPPFLVLSLGLGAFLIYRFNTRPR